MATSNYKPTNKEKDFLHYYDILSRQLINANGHWVIYKYLIDALVEYSREIDVARGFFFLTIQGHYFETIMRLNTFFDLGGDNISIYKLIEFIKQNYDIFSNGAFSRRVTGCTTYNTYMNQHEEIDRRLVDCDKRKLNGLPLQNLRKCRNRALAHINAEHASFRVSVFKQFPIEREEIDAIIDTIDKILDRYRLAYDADHHNKKTPLLESGIKEVLDSIRFRLQPENIGINIQPNNNQLHHDK